MIIYNWRQRVCIVYFFLYKSCLFLHNTGASYSTEKNGGISKSICGAHCTVPQPLFYSLWGGRSDDTGLMRSLEIILYFWRWQMSKTRVSLGAHGPWPLVIQLLCWHTLNPLWLCVINHLYVPKENKRNSRISQLKTFFYFEICFSYPKDLHFFPKIHIFTCTLFSVHIKIILHPLIQKMVGEVSSKYNFSIKYHYENNKNTFSKWLVKWELSTYLRFKDPCFFLKSQ